MSHLNPNKQEQLIAFYELLAPIEAKHKSWFTQHGDNFTIKNILIEATPADLTSFAFRIAEYVPSEIKGEIREAREFIFHRFYKG